MSASDPFARAFAELREDLRRELLAAVDERLEELRAELVRPPADEARALSVGEVCARYKLSRATWDRWLADPGSGLEGVVIRPPGVRRVLVPQAEFEAWLRARRPGGPPVARRRRS